MKVEPGNILKLFLNFSNFEPQYSYRLYSYKKKECKTSFKFKYILRNYPDKIAMKVSRLSNNIPSKNTQNVNAMASYLLEHTRQKLCSDLTWTFATSTYKN